MKNIIITCVVSICLGLSASVFAAVTPTKPAKPGAEQVQVLYKGIIKKHEHGTALITADKTYPLVGGNFAKMIGKEVSIVGKVAKEGEVEKLVVAKLELN